MKNSTSSGPKNILLVTSTMPSSDSDPVPAFVKEQAIWLKKTYQDVNVTILAPHNAYSDTKSYSEHEHYSEYRFHYFWPFKWEKLTGRGIKPALDKNKLLYFQILPLFVCEFFSLWKHTRRLKPDLIYAHWFTPQAITGALVSKLTKTPMVFDTQASDVIVLKKIPFSSKLVVWVCRQAYAYTAPSKQTADKLLYFTNQNNRKEIESKLHLIPMGTSIDAPSAKAVANFRKQYNLTGKTCLLFIGRLVDRKGVDILIKAFANMAKNDDSLALIIAGDGQERDNLTKLVAQHKLDSKVLFTGYVTGDKKSTILGAADILTVPSINVGDHAEGLPVVFMEGVSLGKIAVVSDATGAHETVTDGVNGFIAKAGSVKDLELKISEALKAHKQQKPATKKAIRSLAEQFEWPTITRKHYEVFSQSQNSDL